MTLQGTLDLARAFRQGDNETPLVLMGYLNPILNRGFAAFAADAAEAGFDGLIIVDCPPEEADALTDALDAVGISLIRLATPTTDDARLKIVARRTSGFVYYVSVAGITGMQQAAQTSIEEAVARLKASATIPVAVGFGVRTPEQAAAISKVADGVVVGSALVSEIEKQVGNPAVLPALLSDKLGILRKAIDGVQA